MVRIFKISLFTIFASLITALLLVATVNAFDPPLKPEVEQILQHEPQYSPRQKLAYYYLLGLAAGETENPERKGAELWPQHSTPGFWDKLQKPFQVSFDGCGREVCDSAYIDHHPLIVENLMKYHDQIQNYAQLMRYEEGADLFTGDPQTPLVRLMGLPLPNMHRLFILQLAEWLREGRTEQVFALLTSSNRYLKSFYVNGSLFEHVLAVTDMKMNAEFIKSETERHPQWHLPDKLVESIAVPDPGAILQDGAEHDMHVFENVLHSRLNMGDFALSSLGLRLRDWSDDLQKHISVNLFLRPHEAMNKFYDLSRTAVKTDCALKKSYEECIPGMQWTSLSNPWHWVENPTGRVLTRYFSASLSGQHKMLRKRQVEIRQIKMELQWRG